MTWPRESSSQTNSEGIAGRSYVRPYRVTGRAPLHSFIRDAVRASGGAVRYTSKDSSAPLFLGITLPNKTSLGIVVYGFRCNSAPIRGRPADEHRVQIRYGSEASWSSPGHRLAVDPAGIDSTIVLGVHLELELLVGLQTSYYDPLPMGISVEFKERDLMKALADGWHSWSRPVRRSAGRHAKHQRHEVLSAFVPSRFLEFVERQGDIDLPRGDLAGS
jgi:hypothetical protein